MKERISPLPHPSPLFPLAPCMRPLPLSLTSATRPLLPAVYPIGPEGAAALAAALRVNKALTKLSLRGEAGGGGAKRRGQG